MTDTGDRDRDCSLNRRLLDNVVLKSSYKSSSPTALRYCQLNPGSAAAHIDDINALFDKVDMHVICITETWYKGWHTNKRISIPGFKIIRADRKDGRRGGGVAMYVRSDLKCKILAKSTDACAINYLFVEIKFHGHDCLVGLIYNPPRVDGLPIFAPILEEFYPKYEHGLLLGDLNTDLLQNTTRAIALQQKLDDVSLSIVSKEPTNFSSDTPTLLDVCATSRPEAIEMTSQLSLPGMNTSHDLIYGAYRVCDMIHTETAQEPHYYRNFNRINNEQLQLDIEAQNWLDIYNMTDPDQQLQHLNKIVLWLLGLHAPLRKYIKRDPVNPWFTFDIEKAVIERNIAYKVWKVRKTTTDRDRYKEQRRRVNYLIREAKRAYMRRYLDPKLPARKLWRNLDTVGATDTVDNNIVYTSGQLNSHFTSHQGNVANPNTAVHDGTTTGEFSFCNTYDLEVFNAVWQIKSNAVGTDEIPIKFLRMLLPYIMPHITHIFNTILTSSTFPLTWKTSKVLPLAKKADPGSLSDYRPISVLPALSKAMEIIMKRQIIGHVENFGLLNRFQSGFRKHHSTSTALIKITDDLLRASDSKLTSVLVLLDFSKAFDSVDHELMCAKLVTQYGFTTCAVGLIRSYLSNRTQYVFANGQSSSFLPLTTGVVQGSVLGPILFSLFINDITSQITSCSYHLYADDVQLYISCNPNDIELCINQLNADLCRLYQWSQVNGISINSSKSQAMIINPSQLTRVVPPIHLGDDEIACFPKLRNLGLIMNQELTWNDHITKLCRSVLFTLRRLWTTASFTPTETRKKLVSSLIIPQFLYCDVIFSKTTAGLREKLKVAFNSCARYVFGMSRRQHISEHANKLLGVPLDVFYSYRICHTMYKLIKSGDPGYLHGRLQFGRSRRMLNLITPINRSNSLASSFFVQGAILWNGLPVDVRRESSMGKFKKECLSHLCRSAGGNNMLG
jgi:hypothetical protein